VEFGRHATTRPHLWIWVQPATGGAGSSVGAALATYHLFKGQPRKRRRSRSDYGYERPIKGGQSVTALPRCSDVDLLGDGERVVNLDAEVPDRALHLGVAKEPLNRPELPGPPVNQSRRRSRSKRMAKCEGGGRDPA
jgi:hypothetical protein